MSGGLKLDDLGVPFQPRPFCGILHQTEHFCKVSSHTAKCLVASCVRMYCATTESGKDIMGVCQYKELKILL